MRNLWANRHIVLIFHAESILPLISLAIIFIFINKCKIYLIKELAAEGSTNWQIKSKLRFLLSKFADWKRNNSYTNNFTMKDIFNNWSSLRNLMIEYKNAY